MTEQWEKEARDQTIAEQREAHARELERPLEAEDSEETAEGAV